MRIGPYLLSNKVILAPMAGITDWPFRKICQQFGAGLTVSEMIAVDPALINNAKTRQRTETGAGAALFSVQILGTEPKVMAEAAAYNADCGAKIIDINMGCPAKKVCSKAAGSALLKDTRLVKEILEAVVAAVPVPVTLKIRTGWDRDNRNAVQVARIAQQSGVAALAVHGRTRACKFGGQAEYDTIKQVKQAVTIPVIANGDIDSPEKARGVLDYTKADAVMIGRAAQGNPWLIERINSYLSEGKIIAQPKKSAIFETLINHLDHLYRFHGDMTGLRIARKHIAWYSSHFGSLTPEIKSKINSAMTPRQQMAEVQAALLPYINTGTA